MDQTLLRIIAAMQQQKITDLEMQEYLGIPRGTFSNWKRDKGKSYYQHIDRIADRLGVSIDYLVRGRESGSADLSPQEKELLASFRRIPPDKRLVLLEVSWAFLP